MATEIILIVLSAALLHATWNAMAKGTKGRDPLIGATVIATGAAIVSLALLAVLGLPATASYPYVIASGVIHVVYFLLLGMSYRLADYSAIYPLMRGAAPMITSAGGYLIVGETMSPAALAGVTLLSLGVLGLGFHSLIRGGIGVRGLAVATANIVIIVAYTLIDGLGARLSGNPGGYVSAMMLLTGVLLLPMMAIRKPREIGTGLTSEWHVGLIGGAMVMASYGAALWAMTHAPIGAVAALRETSVLFGAAIGAAFMGERFSPLRVLATVAIFGGLGCMRLA